MSVPAHVIRWLYLADYFPYTMLALSLSLKFLCFMQKFINFHSLSFIHVSYMKHINDALYRKKIIKKK